MDPDTCEMNDKHSQNITIIAFDFDKAREIVPMRFHFKAQSHSLQLIEPKES